MNALRTKALAGLLNLLAVMAVALFVPAWTLDYWQAWSFLAVFSGSVMAITIDLMRRDPRLLERRVSVGPLAEKRTGQQIIQSLAAVAFVAVFVVSGLDHRLGWSRLPTWVVIGGDGLVALGLLVVFLVFRENSFASATIEVGAAQPVIATGPYALVRHPMYLGALVMLAGTPPALASWWALVAVVVIALVIIWRLLDEERFLDDNLAGYRDYRGKVTHRLLPYVW